MGALRDGVSQTLEDVLNLRCGEFQLRLSLSFPSYVCLPGKEGATDLVIKSASENKTCFIRSTLIQDQTRFHPYSPSLSFSL